MQLQKKSIRILSGSHFFAHTNPLFKKEKILKINDIFKLQNYKFYYKFIQMRLPKTLTFLFFKPPPPYSPLPLPTPPLGELTGADTGGGEKAGDVISGVGHTCFAVLYAHLWRRRSPR